MALSEKHSPVSEETDAYGSFTLALPVFTLGALLTTGQMYTIIPQFNELREHWGVGPHAMAWTLSAFAIGYAVGMLVSGPGSNKFGFRRWSSIGMIAAAVVTLLISLAPWYSLALLLRVVQGLTTGAFAPSVMTYIGRHLRPHHRGIAATAVLTSFIGAVIVAQMASQYLTDHVNRQAVWYLSALGLLALAVALRSVMIADRPHFTGSIWKSIGQLPQVFTHASLVRLYFVMALPMTVGVAVFTGFELTGIVTDSDELLALRAVALPFLALVPLVAIVLRRFSLNAQILGSLVVAGAAVLTMAIAPPHPVLLGITAALFLASTGIANPAILQSAMRIAPQFGASANSGAMFINYVGATLGPIVAAGVAGFGMHTLAWVLLALVVASLGLAVRHSRVLGESIAT
ncbi:MFS transporter [Haloglycomyces albus]|uniref:MFS transporter n=1 Tax=Haloglycomyces albus TaxID=526067 RepID=UPI00046D35AD|nr:MFS transporter [Haloglycomyces albus]